MVREWMVAKRAAGGWVSVSGFVRVCPGWLRCKQRLGIFPASWGRRSAVPAASTVVGQTAATKPSTLITAQHTPAPLALPCSIFRRLPSPACQRRLHFCGADTQKRYFARQFELARSSGLPMFLHLRAAAADFLQIVEQHAGGWSDKGCSSAAAWRAAWRAMRLSALQTGGTRAAAALQVLACPSCPHVGLSRNTTQRSPCHAASHALQPTSLPGWCTLLMAALKSCSRSCSTSS